MPQPCRRASRVLVTAVAVLSLAPTPVAAQAESSADFVPVTDAMLDTGSNDPVVPPCGVESMRVAEPRAVGRTVRLNPADKGSAMWGALEKWYFASGEQSYPPL